MVELNKMIYSALLGFVLFVIIIAFSVAEKFSNEEFFSGLIISIVAIIGACLIGKSFYIAPNILTLRKK